MRAYIITTGVIFALIVVAHAWRIIAESSALATDPGFLLLTVAAAALSLWAARLVRRGPPA
jgi:hypothetical protein